GSSPPPEPPRRPTPYDRKQLEDLRSLFKPDQGLKHLDDFAKWLFATTAIVGTLGAAFSNKAFDELTGIGKVTFAFAVVALGVSLAAAALSVAPKWVTFNPYSRDSMSSAIQQIYSRRRLFLYIAAPAFATALILAAVSPLL